MGLLDDDDVPPFVPRKQKMERDNERDLGLLGTHRQSLDFSDSPFADRQADHECDYDMGGYCYQCKKKNK